jgi:hypothetical protein
MLGMFFHCYSISHILSTDCKYKVIVIYFHATHICLIDSTHHTHPHCFYLCLTMFGDFSFLVSILAFCSSHLSSCNEQDSLYEIMSFSVCICFYLISDIDISSYLSNLFSSLAFPTNST